MNRETQEKQPVGQILSFNPTGDFYFTKGIEAYDRDDLENAKKYLERATQLERDEPMFWFQLAIIYTDLEMYEESNELLQKIITEIDKDFSECNYLFASNYAYLGYLEDAYYYATSYMENNPSGQFIEEVEELLELLQFELEMAFDDDDRLILWQDRAKKLLSEQRYGESIELLTELIEQYPEFWSAYNNLAIAYFYSGDVEKSSELIETVLSENEGNLHAMCNKLLLLYYEGKISDANNLASGLAKVKPIISEHRLKLGTTFAIIGRHEDSFQLLKPLTNDESLFEDESLYEWLAYSAYYSGRTTFAQSAWKKLIFLNPDKIGLEPWNDKSKLLSEKNNTFN